MPERIKRAYSRKKVSTVDSTDWMDAIDSVDLASDPLFGPAAIVLLLGAFTIWVWNTDFQDND